MGSAPTEWYQGQEAADILVVQAGLMPEFHYDVSRLEAFEEGAVGWAAADTIANVSNTASALRMTAVFTLENGCGESLIGTRRHLMKTIPM